ncbi:MAG: DNA polymerase III subunit beta [Actinomycetia bacterium]|nr:DNA polymerase III subunit beta [Actinomycetes bacterium]
MKFTASRAQLSDIVAAASKATGHTPETSGIQLTVDEAKLVVAATNLEMGIRARMEITDGDDGTVIVPAKLFANLIKSLEDGNVIVEVTDSGVEVTCDNGEYQMSALQGVEFPSFKDVEGTKVDLSTEALSLIVDLVAGSASTDITRAALCGVRIEGSKDGNVHVVATDSYRLAHLDLGVVEGVDAGTEATIPAKALIEARRHVGDEVTVTLGKNAVAFRSGDIEVRSRLIVGAYPAWQAVMDVEQGDTMVVNGDELAAVVRRVSLMDATKAPSVTLALAEGQLNVASGGVGGGSGSETITVVSDAEFQLRLNAGYLASLIDSVGGGKVAFAVSEPLKPVFITADGLTGWQAMIMPMR